MTDSKNIEDLKKYVKTMNEILKKKGDDTYITWRIIKEIVEKL